VKTMAMLAMAVLLMAGCGGGKPDNPRVRTSGSLTGQLAFTPDPPVVGHDNSFTVTLTENGAPVTGATVNLALFFKGLSKDGPSATCTQSAPGQYEARDLSAPMGGAWEATVTVARPNQPDAKLVYPFTVAR
jgi:hypothetical protein